jgi:hypothetical protein
MKPLAGTRSGHLGRRCLTGLLWASLLHGPVARAEDDYPTPEQAQPVSVERLAALHAGGVAYLRTTVGEAQANRLLAATAALPGGLHIVAACVGSFDRPGPVQAVLGLVTADARRLVYAAYGLQASPQVLWDEQPPPGRVAGVMQRFPSVRCLPWTAVERANARRLAAGGEQIVKRRSFMDVACVAPMQSDFEYVCHGWDDRRRRWERLGGWMQP